jgi:hypothetical protein
MRLNDSLKRQAIRAALRIHDHLTSTSRTTGVVQLPTHEWDESAKLLQRLEYALRRGWRVASDSLLADLEYSLRRLRTECDTCHVNLPRSTVAGRLALPGEIVADILALHAEFDDLAIILEEKLLQVQTDLIVLNDTALGRFRIELRWDLIGRQRAYEVIAETPNTPENDQEVTHPHVRDRQLCEGEGAAPIRRALAEGRVLDFFTLVRQLLNTYNSGSAYVELRRWNGVACKDCGYIMPGDDHGVCDRCEDPLCSDCSIGCSRCDRYVCNSCSTSCEACERTLCESCLQAADDSGRLLCPTCLEETLEESNENLCPQEDDSPDPAIHEAGAAPAVNALCVGEAPIPA